MPRYRSAPAHNKDGHGRTFVTRMHSVAAKFASWTSTRLREFNSDLQWWHIYPHAWNGMNLLCLGPDTSPLDNSIQIQMLLGLGTVEC